jgi:flagellar hook-basal body complex protein FliE
MMNINGINPLATPLPLAPANQSATAAQADATPSSFGSTVSSALEALDRSQKGAEQEIARAVAGESPDLHRTVIALQTAELNFQLALQVRNKFIGAYEEIMRMQV